MSVWFYWTEKILPHHPPEYAKALGKQDMCTHFHSSNNKNIIQAQLLTHANKVDGTLQRMIANKAFISLSVKHYSPVLNTNDESFHLKPTYFFKHFAEGRVLLRVGSFELERDYKCKTKCSR